ncbi:hypothetical protein [Streptomyces sp. NPDC049585]|uniref:hypothetical protein n=1 Tax=Streptomyces sp. NPDC049585 TaxID=3155154 RepID=UPI0034145A95
MSTEGIPLITRLSTVIRRTPVCTLCEEPCGLEAMRGGLCQECRLADVPATFRPREADTDGGLA